MTQAKTVKPEQSVTLSDREYVSRLKYWIYSASKEVREYQEKNDIKRAQKAKEELKRYKKYLEKVTKKGSETINDMVGKSSVHKES